MAAHKELGSSWKDILDHGHGIVLDYNQDQCLQDLPECFLFWTCLFGDSFMETQCSCCWQLTGHTEISVLPHAKQSLLHNKVCYLLFATDDREIADR